MARCSACLGMVFAVAAGCAAAPAQTAGRAPASPQPVVTAASAFREAKAAAANLPSPLAERELQFIADDELVATPVQAIKDFERLYREVHAWPVDGTQPADETRADLRYRIELAAIEAVAGRGKFDEAMTWAGDFDPGNRHQQYPSGVYSQVILDMLVRGDYARVAPAIQACVTEGDGFPFEGTATALAAAKMPEMQREELASEGVAAAGTATDTVPAAARFLGQVHNVFPRIDGEVEDAILSLLAASQPLAQQHPDSAADIYRGGALLLSLLDQIDPGRAASVRASFPAASTARQDNGLRYIVSPTGQVKGAAIGVDPLRAIGDRAASDPGQALTDAGMLTDVATRFAALAQVANALARQRPELAGQAASAAHELLDPDVALAETGYVVILAQAFEKLGNGGAAAEIAGAALDAADRHAQDAEAQFDLSTPDGVAAAAKNLTLPAVALTYAYEQVAVFQPQLALSHARGCKCGFARGLVLAKVAEGMSPGGAKVRY